jgi:lycopene cyclase domain-containing protein
MTYFGFLAIFLLVPIFILAYVFIKRNNLIRIQNTPYLKVIITLVIVAVSYTTPWDNYLVANQVWGYDIERVTGITIGWVPIEEYTFFVLQTVLIALWLTYLVQRIKIPKTNYFNQKLNLISAGVGILIWIGSGYVLFVGWQAGTYLALILVWALPPVIVQFAYGADILWHYRSIIIPATLAATFYLSAADALAIASGVWTIDPITSLNIYIGGVLPVEEFVFFSFTVVLITFGMILAIANESKERARNAKIVKPLIKSLEIE